MKLLVTGGAGFIGSNLIRYLLGKYQDYRIYNLDKLTYAGKLEYLSDIENRGNYTFIKGDIVDRELVGEVVSSGIDYIINLAAESHVDRSIIDSRGFVQTNVLGTQVLLEAARNYGIRKFVQISTDEVYGTLGLEGCFTEKSPLAPNNPYAASKASADLLVRSYYRTYNLPVNTIRSSNNFGPRQLPEKLIPLIITRALEDKELPIYGDGLQIRDWVYVLDHCQAVDLVLHKGRKGEVYNVGASNEWTNIDLIRLILKKLGKPESLIRYVGDRPGHDRRYAIDAGKIKTELGWQPEYDFEEALDKTVEWYKKSNIY